MNEDIKDLLNDYNRFCEKYYETAKNDVEKHFFIHIKRFGAVDDRLDVDGIIEDCILHTLENTFQSFDVNYEKPDTLNSYIDRLAHNKLISELKKATTQLGRENIDSDCDVSEDTWKGSGLKTYGVAEKTKKADRDATHDVLLHCIRKLKPFEQLVIYCSLIDPKKYTGLVLEKMKWGKDRAGYVNLTFKKAKDSLAILLNSDIPKYAPEYKARAVRCLDNSAAIESYQAVKKRKKKFALMVTHGIDYEKMADMLAKQLSKSK